jgi:competence protein ComEC
VPRINAIVFGIIASQQGHLFPWLPVFLGGGVGLFFSLQYEPFGAVILVAAIGLIALVLMPLAGFFWRAVLMAIAAVSIGFVLAAIRSHSVAESVLTFRYYGPVEGRRISIDKSASEAVRLTLDHVVLRNVSPTRTPMYVRVSLHGDQTHFTPKPGEIVVMAAHLSPPSGPVEPGGFDFQRHAWFQKLGAVGYTRSPVLVIVPASSALKVARLRHRLAKAIRIVLPDQNGAFAVGVITGDRSGISQENMENLRASNLAHLLAISGLHMGMLTGVVFGVIRGGLALVPRLGMRVPSKKVAAVGALMAATFYLVLSGGAIATERAYIMVFVALLAILLDRRAISLRAVSVAAILVLVRTPEAMLGPGFQMSFAATTALVGVFSAIRDSGIKLGPKWLRTVSAVVISSAVAGLATAPFGAAHFNQIAQLGLLANLLSVPVMGAVVMPGAVLAAILAPVGVGWIGLNISAFGLSWILFVADWISGFENAVRMVPQPALMTLPILVLGGLWIVLVHGRSRWAGLVAIGVGLLAWGQVQRPYILISDNGGLVGVMTPKGRALSKIKGSGFVADVWLENDGNPATQAEAFDQWSNQIRHVTGKKTVEAITDCAVGEILVVNTRPADDLPCHVISPAVLRQTGSQEISPDGVVTTSKDVHGSRIWHPWTKDQ